MQELIKLLVAQGYYAIEYYSKQRCVDGDEMTFRARCKATRSLKEVTVKNMQVVSVC